jgi:hypothetical protein
VAAGHGAPAGEAGGGGAFLLRAGGGLELELTSDARIGAISLDGRKLPSRREPAFAVSEVLRRCGTKVRMGAVVGTVRPMQGRLHLEGKVPNAALQVEADFRSRGGRISVDGVIRDLSGADRAVEVTFNLPLELEGWEWHDTPFRRRTVKKDQRFPLIPKDTEWMARKRRGFWRRNPERKMWIPVNRLPCSAVTRGRAGLALAYPLHEPRVFLIGASAGGYSISFSLGLTPATKRFPSLAGFRFVIYPVEAAWGVRSALERYQRFFPELYASRAASRHGNAGGFRTVKSGKWPEGMEDFNFIYAENDFQWYGGEMTAADAANARRLKLEPFHWRGAWYWFHETPKTLSPDAQLALLKAQAEGRASGAHGTNNQLCGCPDRISARGAYNSYIENQNGKLERSRQPRGYGQWLMPMNMNPDLPRPNRASLALDWQYRYIKLWDRPDFRGPRNFAWDALDDFGGFRALNFRRSHFAYESVPVTFDPESGRLCQPNGFSHWAFARKHANMVRRRGGLIMCNCNQIGSAMFCGRYIDVFYRERFIRKHSDEMLFLYRAHAGRKPICFQPGRLPRDLKEREAVIRRVLLFGTAPGAQLREFERELCRKYMPVLARIGAAGWHALTRARAEGLLVERFGERPGELFFAVRNTGGEKVAGRLLIESEVLGPEEGRAALRVRELVERREVTSILKDGQLAVSFDIGPGETLVLEVLPSAGKR